MLRAVYNGAVCGGTETINQFQSMVSTAIEPIRDELAGPARHVTHQIRHVRTWR